MMQFEYTANVVGVSRVLVEGRTFCAVYIAESPEPEKERDIKGSSLRKISADLVVFDQFDDLVPGKLQQKTLIMTLKQAAGGKSQPYVLGVVASKPAPAQAGISQSK